MRVPHTGSFKPLALQISLQRASYIRVFSSASFPHPFVALCSAQPPGGSGEFASGKSFKALPEPLVFAGAMSCPVRCAGAEMWVPRPPFGTQLHCKAPGCSSCPSWALAGLARAFQLPGGKGVERV